MALPPMTAVLFSCSRNQSATSRRTRLPTRAADPCRPAGRPRGDMPAWPARLAGSDRRGVQDVPVEAFREKHMPPGKEQDRSVAQGDMKGVELLVVNPGMVHRRPWTCSGRPGELQAGAEHRPRHEDSSSRPGRSGSNCGRRRRRTGTTSRGYSTAAVYTSGSASRRTTTRPLLYTVRPPTMATRTAN